MVSHVSTAVLALGQLPVPGKGQERGWRAHLKPGCGVGRMKLWVWGAGARHSDDGSRVETLSLE